MASTSPRSLGKGRVLGSKPPQPSPLSQVTVSKQLASSPSQDTLKAPTHHGFLSPSESSLSLNSQQSTSKSSNDDQDISAVLAQQAKERENRPGGGGSVLAQNVLKCPICEEELSTELQLSRHFDDVHPHTQPEEKDEIQDWFRTRFMRAKRFQPLAALNQKLKGLDVFDLNEDRRSVSSSPAPAHRRDGSTGRSPKPLPNPPSQTSPQQAVPTRVVDSDEVVKNDHWQRATRDGTCSDPMCNRRLGGVDGRVNCRKCGLLFCEEHTMYQMKLSRSAQHEPVRGYWCRVCETCFKSREGYNDHKGVEVDSSKLFKSSRQSAVDKASLHVTRLQTRVTKLTQALADTESEPAQGPTSYFRRISGQKSKQRLIEESIVSWEDDIQVSHCPFCKQEFSAYTFGRHHCRVCGRVVCADLTTDCSTEVGLDVKSPRSQSSQDGVPSNDLLDGTTHVQVRMCRDCKATLFDRADYSHSVASSSLDERTFRDLKRFEEGIRAMLPRFERLLLAFKNTENPPSTREVSEAERLRKRLTEGFTQYEIAARKLRDLPTESPTQQKLQKQVYLSAAQFLRERMLPLKALPKVLKSAPRNNIHQHGRSTSSASVESLGGLSQSSSTNADGYSKSEYVMELEAQEQQAREKLIVLEEQQMQVAEMLENASRRRKFEEVDSLGHNVAELDREITSLKWELEGLKEKFERHYGA